MCVTFGCTAVRVPVVGGGLGWGALHKGPIALSGGGDLSLLSGWGP
jgi:hypothetical protein